MKKEKRFTEELLCAVLLVGITFGIVAGAAVYAWMHPIFQSHVWASWVQALGSVGAIVGAYLLGERQYKRDRNERRELELSRLNGALNRVTEAIVLAQNRVGFFALQISGEPPHLQSERLEDIQDCLGVFKEALSDVKCLPKVWVQGVQISQNLRKIYELGRRGNGLLIQNKEIDVVQLLQLANNFLQSAELFKELLRREFVNPTSRS